MMTIINDKASLGFITPDSQFFVEKTLRVGDEEEVPQPGVLPRSQCTQHEELKNTPHTSEKAPLTFVKTKTQSWSGFMVE